MTDDTITKFIFGLIVAFVALLTASFFVAPAHSQVTTLRVPAVCVPSEDSMLALLKNLYGEYLVWTGPGEVPGSYIAIYENPFKRTWSTVLVDPSNNQYCVVFSGGPNGDDT